MEWTAGIVPEKGRQSEGLFQMPEWVSGKLSVVAVGSGCYPTVAGWATRFAQYTDSLKGPAALWIDWCLLALSWYRKIRLLGPAATLWFRRGLSASLVFHSRGCDSEKVAVEANVERVAAAKSWKSEWS